MTRQRGSKLRVEPVRILWIAVVAIGALLGVGGVGDYIPDAVLFWLGAGYLVGVAVFGEITRNRVTPVADPRDADGNRLVSAPGSGERTRW